MAKQAPHRVHSAYRAQSHFIRPTAAALAVAACFSGPVLANPSNPTVVHGTATFATAGNILNITNGHNAIINWGSFSIGVNELTRFIQPSALSAVLNRITGQDPSVILGALQSNGRVFLLNPNGIVFGAGAQINVAGLVASTLNLSNDDFLNNRMRFTDGAGAGSVVNQGSITGGNVYLVGKSVSNEGLITSPNGEVVLAAGNSVELVNPGTPNLRVEIVAPDNEARNLGTISAEAGRIGIYAGLIHNSGTLNASSAVAEGGKILLKAKKDITLTSTSVIDVSGQGGGEIIAFADNNTYVDGTLNASAPVSGNGGFIETSGKNRVKIADSAIITTVAADGANGTWLIDPSDFVIAYGGDISGSTLTGLLNGGNVVISTAYAPDAYAYGSGVYGGNNGDILVQDAVSWNSANSLTLTAERNVQVDQAITNIGTGGINLNAGWDGAGNAATPSLTNSVGGILLNAPVSSAGTVNLNAAGSIIQGASAPIAAANLQANSIYGMVSLDGSTNLVGTLAGSAVGAFTFKNSGNLTIGSSGITVAPGSGMHSMINVEVTGGQLTVNSPVYAYGGDGSEGQAGGNATITLASSSSMQINGSITADGGEGSNDYFGTVGAGGNATVNLTSGSGLTIAANVQANGGSGGYGDNSANGGRGGDGVVNATAAGTLSVSGAYGGVIGQGGQGGYSYYGGQAGRGGDGKVMLSAVGGIMIDGQVRGTGSAGGDTDSYGGSLGGNGGDGIVLLTSSGGSITVTDSVEAQGGTAGSGDGGETGMGGNALVLISSSSGISALTGSEVEAIGGDADDGTGGAAAVTMLAGGNIQIEGGEGAAWGGSGNTGGNASVLLVAGGNITLANNQTAVLLAETDGGDTSSVIVAAAGNVSVSSADIYSDGTVGLGGANIMLDDATVSASSSASAGATGSLSLMNYSTLTGGNNVYITTGGNVTVDNSQIYGNPEVVMNVGGVINMNNLGTIEAGSPSTILLTFPMLTSGGFFVNGLEGVVYDSGTGFVVQGYPAELGVNLFVTYGGGAPPLNIPTNSLIVAMGESTEPPDAEKNKDLFEELKKEEKEAPVCR